MGRPRQRKDRRDWPTGLNARTRKGTVYYSYQDPTTKREIGLGIDRAAAIQAVRTVLRNRAPEPVQAAISRIEKPRKTVDAFVDWFLKEYLPAKRNKRGEGLSASTLSNYRIYLERARMGWGSRDMASPDRAAVVELLDEMPADAANKARGILSKFFAQARARGLRDDNPVEGTVKRDTVVQRDRLEQKHYDKIYEKAPAWLQRAMQLSLVSLQRPSDLCRSRRADWKDGVWKLRQSKSYGAGYGLLRITPHAELRAALEDCRKHQVDDCPFLLGYEPEKKRDAEGREHWAQLSDEILSRAFAEVRDTCAKKYRWRWKGKPPPYYEIKSLGSRRYGDQGKPKAWIQQLLGHQNEQTTRIYLERGEEKWAEVCL